MTHRTIQRQFQTTIIVHTTHTCTCTCPPFPDLTHWRVTVTQSPYTLACHSHTVTSHTGVIQGMTYSTCLYSVPGIGQPFCQHSTPEGGRLARRLNTFAAEGSPTQCKHMVQVTPTICDVFMSVFHCGFV